MQVAFGISVVLQFGNTMLLASFLPSCLLTCTVSQLSLSLLVHYPPPPPPPPPSLLVDVSNVQNHKLSQVHTTYYGKHRITMTTTDIIDYII